MIANLLLLPLCLAGEADLDSTNADLWREEFDRAESELPGAIRTWIARTETPTSTSAEEADTRDELSRLRARRGALQTERELRKQGIAEARRRRAQWIERRDACPLTQASVSGEVEEMAAETLAQVETTRTLLDGSDRRAARALDAWWEAWQGVDWERAWATEDGLDALMRARADLNEAALALEGPAADAVSRLRMQADDEERRRLALYRTGLDCAALQVEPVEFAHLLDSEVRLSALEGDLFKVEERIHALEAQLRAGAEVGDGLHAKLTQLDDTYRRLAQGLDSLDAPLSQESLCEVLIHGALARLAVHGADAEDLLSTAAGAREGACNPYAQEWLDVPVFQSAWVLAQTGLGQPLPLLRLEMDAGEWKVDGLPVEGLNHVTLNLRPGLHRIEHSSADGRAVRSVMLQLAEEDRLLLRATVEGVAMDGFQDTPTPRRGDWDPTQILVKGPPEPEAPPRRWSLTLAPLLMRFDGMSHAGGTAQLNYRVLRASWVDLELGLAHDQTMGPYPYAYVDGKMDSRFLLRERLVLSARGGSEWPLRPVIALSVGAVPLNALTLSGELGLEIPLGDVLFVSGAGSLGTSIWSDVTTPWEPAAALGVGARL